MLILDTNILAALMLVRPDPKVVEWLNEAPAQSLWITTVTVFEVRFGIAALPAGRKRERLSDAFGDLVTADLGGRVLEFDVAAAEQAAALAGERRAQGQTVEIRDTMMAGIALARKAAIVTRNTKDLQHPSLRLINPWQGAAG
ncbi:MAG: type II toxin-antitoxin system VapC family toxin [Betaproteobacteria bacterium]|nr:MAG: type II toxin-antitoxin system VapC family toxin [Betaproteobacteria bacterium]